jgi:hypothetical protein
MEISASRFELALKEPKSSDWEKFERLASAFLASEWLDLRTTACPGGDGGRDAEIFSPKGSPNVVIQYSIAEDWKTKIKHTLNRLTDSLPEATILVYLTNQRIGARADGVKKDFSTQGKFLDVRDASWFLERFNLDANRSAAAVELARLIVDPLFEAGGLLTASGAALTGSEARTAFLFLELQWHNETAGKGLTKSSFDALVRGALNGTNNSQRINRTEIHNRIGKFLPQHDISKLKPYIDGSLRRLTKSAIRH